jgi:uncharacterized protein
MTVPEPAPPLAPDQPLPAIRRNVLHRGLYLVVAVLALVLGIIGIVVPGLPTTPFVLLAAWAAARSSQRLHDWLRAHRLFGPMIRDWQARGAVSRRAKWAATIAMAVCALIFFLTAPRIYMAATGTAIMAIVAIWLWRRPE